LIKAKRRKHKDPKLNITGNANLEQDISKNKLKCLQIARIEIVEYKMEQWRIF